MAQAAQTSLNKLIFGRHVDHVDSAVVPWQSPVLVGRILLAGIFLLSAVSKLGDWGATVELVRAHGAPMPSVLLGCAIALEIVGSVSVIAGLFARLGAVLLLLFLVPTTLLMHDFWTLEGAERQMQLARFMANVSIAGGLLLLVGFGAGHLSADARVGHEEPNITE